MSEEEDREFAHSITKRCAVQVQPSKKSSRRRFKSPFLTCKKKSVRTVDDEKIKLKARISQLESQLPISMADKSEQIQCVESLTSKWISVGQQAVRDLYPLWKAHVENVRIGMGYLDEEGLGKSDVSVPAMLRSFGVDSEVLGGWDEIENEFFKLD